MRKAILVILAVLVLILGNSVSGEAARGFHGHGHGHFGVDVVVGPGWGPWWGPYPYYYPYPYATAPVVIQSEPELIVEPQPQEQQYRYYCKDPGGYYPYVKQCPKGWMKVVPAPAPSGPEE